MGNGEESRQLPQNKQVRMLALKPFFFCSFKIISNLASRYHPCLFTHMVGCSKD